MGAVRFILTDKAKDDQVAAFVNEDAYADSAAKGMLEAFGAVHCSQTQGLGAATIPNGRFVIRM